METTERELGEEKEQLLREDRRLLGRLLGEVISEQVGAATLVELTQARATQLQAQSAVINASNNLVFQQSLMSYYTGELNPAASLALR